MATVLYYIIWLVASRRPASCLQCGKGSDFGYDFGLAAPSGVLSVWQPLPACFRSGSPFLCFRSGSPFPQDRLAFWAKGSDFGRFGLHFEQRVQTLGAAARILSQGFTPLALQPAILGKGFAF